MAGLRTTAGRPGGNPVRRAGEQRAPGGMTPVGKGGTSRLSHGEKCLERGFTKLLEDMGDSTTGSNKTMK